MKLIKKSFFGLLFCLLLFIPSYSFAEETTNIVNNQAEYIEIINEATIYNDDDEILGKLTTGTILSLRFI